ncbi:hypothetical protein B1218_32115 [Pseudomonas ogarae]|nr:hypothetical protein B1218_32115 [Pseudomonas ogarae]
MYGDVRVANGASSAAQESWVHGVGACRTSTWRFDEAGAILAGDGLQSLAFTALLDPALSDCPAQVRLDMVSGTGAPVPGSGRGTSYPMQH